MRFVICDIFFFLGINIVGLYGWFLYIVLYVLLFSFLILGMYRSFFSCIDCWYSNFVLVVFMDLKKELKMIFRYLVMRVIVIYV